MNVLKVNPQWCSVLIVMFAIICVNGVAQAKVLYVANYGVDASDCGTITLPCRSISQAIAVASDRDRIIVGPGHYGDLNSDGDFEDPGEEKAEIGHGCFCVIKIDKQLSFESSDGTEVTVLDAGGADVNVVSIEASQVVFGKIKLGFTLTGAKRAGLIIADNNISWVNIMSNISIANGGDGFSFAGAKHSLSDNIASGNVNAGFNFSGSDQQLKNNLSIKNATGFSFSGDRHVLIGDVASANHSDGFHFAGNVDTLRNDVASRNEGYGFFMGGNEHTLNTIAAVGNALAGIFIDLSKGKIKITRSNIYGNENATETVGGATLANCGLINFSGVSANAVNNFWGGANGPGADPADKICNAKPGSKTSFTVFAKRPFRVVTRDKSLEPQPGKSSTALEDRTIFASNPRSYELSVCTLTGQLIAKITDQTQWASAIRSLPNGIYLTVTVTADKRRELAKFVVIR